MTLRDRKVWTILGPALSSTLAESTARVLAFVFFAVLARFAGPGLFGEVRAALSAGQIAAGLGVPFLTSVSRSGRALSLGHGTKELTPPDVSPELTGWVYFIILGALAAGSAFG